MPRRAGLAWALWACLLTPWPLAGCGGEAPEPPTRALTVETLALERSAPERAVAVTGVASAYREAQIGFDVGGRVLMVRDVGEEVEGPRKGPDGALLPGEVIAHLDDRRYRQALEAAELQLAAGRAAVKALEVEVADVAPATIARAVGQRDAAASQAAVARAQIAGARSARDTAQREYDRLERLADGGRISVADLDAAKNTLDTAQSQLDQALSGAAAAAQQQQSAEAALSEARAMLALKRENLERQRAEVAILVNQRDRAQTDLEDTVLRATFSGRITAVHVSRGGSVSPGAPVVTLTLVDPIQVTATVSAADERRIRPGVHVAIDPRGVGVPTLSNGLPIHGVVFEKASVADAATRTFRVDAMLRNWRVERLARGGDDEIVLTVRDLAPVIEAFAAEGGRPYVYERAIMDPDGDPFVLVLADPDTKRPIEGRRYGGRTAFRRVPVKPGNRYRTFLSWTFREVEPADASALPLFAMVYAPRVLAEAGLDPARLLAEGAFVETNQWAVRPGDLIPIRIETGRLPEGYWVPVRAIVDLNGKRNVYVVESGRARAVPIEVTPDADGELRRIEGDGLREGLAVVVRGVGFLSDGAPVRVTGKAGS